MIPLFILLFLQTTCCLADLAPFPSSNLGTFETPSARSRARFRYWLPDAGVDKEIVASNIKASGARGAGGVEFLPFYNYGGEIDTPAPEADWVTNGFGTPAFREMFRAALEAHREAGLVMDFALGPNQGQGVPAESGDEGLQWDLVPCSVEVPGNGSFDGRIPGWGTGDLVAVVSAFVISETNVSLPGVNSAFVSGQDGYRSLVVDHGSLNDITERVSSDGHLSISFSPVTGVGYRIFAYYQKRTLHKNLTFDNNRTATIWDNGSYAVDHYSATGAQTTIAFWEKHILIDGIKELLMEVGNYGIPDSGAGYINDFRGVLADGYHDYLQALTKWTHSLNLTYSAQVSYNLPMDTLTNVPVVDAPECESLQFGDNIDGYRQFSGPAYLAGKAVVSNEMGAISAAYNYPLPRLLYSIASAVAGGVNQFVLHGQSYTGNYYETTWPGYTAFSYSFSELYSDKQPSWDHGMPEVLEYIARVQYIQRQGIPRTDVAIYSKTSATDPSFGTIYQSDDLLNGGWSWSYLSPDNFALPHATVQDGVFGPDGPRYKALVLTRGSNLTLAGVRQIQKYAASGLPVIFSGLPGVYAAGESNQTTSTAAALKTLATSENVHNATEGGVAEKLEELGLSPNVRVRTNGTWWTTWREDLLNDMDYAFIFCDAHSSSGEITVGPQANGKTPYFFNAWTGERSPVFTYTEDDSGLTIPLSMQGNQTIILAFSPPLTHIKAPRMHAIRTPSSVIGHSQGADSWTVQVASQRNGSSKSIILSNGRKTTLPSATSIASAFKLRNWDLVAEHWEAPANFSDAETIAQKSNTTHKLPALISWSEIPALQNVSGLGFYSTTFQWPPNNTDTRTADGAYIYFPSILHSIQVSINGQRLPPMDLTNAKADIGPYLQEGENEVLAVVPTTMWNYIRSILSDIRDQGRLPGLLTVGGGAVPPISENGLVGEVSVVPYVNVVVKG
ncbi:hypothetical protein BJX99DRAFT_268992 [Aspergillus californicus]